MTIAPRVAWSLKRRLQVLSDEIPPKVKPLQEEIAPAKFKICLEKIMREVNRTPSDIGCRDESVKRTLRLFRRQSIGEDRQTLRVLRKGILRFGVCHHAALFAPECRYNLPRQRIGTATPPCGKSASPIASSANATLLSA